MKLKSIIENGGATIGQNGLVNRKKGYQISKKDLAIVPVYKLRKKDLESIVAGLKPREYLGVWIDNGKAYIDISERKMKLEQALNLGKKRNQISILDWSTMDCISCEEGE